MTKREALVHQLSTVNQAISLLTSDSMHQTLALIRTHSDIIYSSVQTGRALNHRKELIEVAIEHLDRKTEGDT